MMVIVIKAHGYSRFLPRRDMKKNWQDYPSKLWLNTNPHNCGRWRVTRPDPTTSWPRKQPKPKIWLVQRFKPRRFKNVRFSLIWPDSAAKPVVGLFRVYIGIFWVYTGLISSVYRALLSVHRALLSIYRANLSAVWIGLFWVSIGLFWVSIGLFWVYIGLFWVYIGLFWVCALSRTQEICEVYLWFLKCGDFVYGGVVPCEMIEFVTIRW